MKLSTLICLASLKGNQSEMISRFLKANQIELSTFVIVSKNLMLDWDLNPNVPTTFYVQYGHRIEKGKINPNKFFFAIMKGCGTESTIIIPNPQEFNETT